MKAYSTWEFYKDIYKGNETEESYNSLSIIASIEINALTNGNAESDGESMQENLSFAECMIVDALAEKQSIGLPSGATSVNNDGFSVTLKDSADTAYASKIGNIGNMLLTRPINLMFAGVKTHNVNI